MVKLPVRQRAGFTLAETAIALAAVAVLGVVVAQCLVWSQRERQRSAAERAAVELAANILEAARARPFEQLDRDWATGQTVPAAMHDLLPAGKVVVTLEPLEPKQPLAQTRRVTVEVRWQFDPQMPAQSVSLTTVLSGRTAKKTGGEP
jgi:type II secretory pathway pseudopilin PulG